MVTVGKDSTPLELLEKQYVAELVKVDAAEDLLQRLERGISCLKWGQIARRQGLVLASNRG